MALRRTLASSVATIRPLAMGAAAVVLLASQVLAGSATAAQAPDYVAQAKARGLTAAQADRLQNRVEEFLDKHPDSKQIAAGKATIPGGTVTFAVPGATTASTAAITCGSGWLCIEDGYGNRYEYFKCGYYDFYGAGDGVFTNNQTSGTVARLFNHDGSLRWWHWAKGSGTASWTPVWHIRPCGRRAGVAGLSLSRRGDLRAGLAAAPVTCSCRLSRCSTLTRLADRLDVPRPPCGRSTASSRPI